VLQLTWLHEDANINGLILSIGFPMIYKVVSHIKRISYHFGKKINIGGKYFKIIGYHPSRFDTSIRRHENYFNDIISNHLNSRPGTFIDVGVNIGQTLIKVLSADSDRSYLGFEPQITCCFNIDKFIKINTLKNAVVLPIALSDSNGITSFYSKNETDEMASMISNDHSEENRGSSHVNTRIGDEVLRELNVKEISIIKIDVEGAELNVLRGLKNTLTNIKPIIIFEVLPNFSGASRRIMHSSERCFENLLSADKIFDLLISLNYEVYQIDENSREFKISKFNLDDMDNFISSNYIAHPTTFSAL